MVVGTVWPPGGGGARASIVSALHKKGPANLPANFRSIAMLDGVARLWHSQVRRTVGQQVIAHYLPTHPGSVDQVFLHCPKFR